MRFARHIAQMPSLKPLVVRETRPGPDIRDDVGMLDYAEITDLVVEEITSNPVNLIEKLAGRIAERVLNQHLKVQQVSVTVHKPQAPVAAQLKDIAVVVTRVR
jgi:dihydroneopterin aldolase